ncbi:extracellular solute-binding protein [Streptomyces sp. SBT349]|uniref:extracellular solute-binding protein n=1 Tax=Streptomyces sp. SBT349 TaxID=1580539 RepID=UPI000AEE5A39|nr:extracellular solute-binding protein [Streptomyces sp. SBT349]
MTALSRRRLLAGIGGLAAGAALGGCAGRGSGDGSTITLMNWEALDGSPYPTVFSDFERSSGKSIDYQFAASGSDYWVKIRTVLGASNPPDLIRIDDDFVASYAATGRLHDLRPYLSDSGLSESDYFPTVFNNTRQPDGAVVGWSLGIQPRVIFYNRTMFEEEGIPLPPTTWTDEGWTWDDFVSAATALSIPNERWGACVLDDSGFEMIYTVNNGGTGRWSRDGRSFTLADRPDAEGFQWVADLTCAHDAQPPWSELQQSGRGAELFAAGQIGMIQRVSSFVNFFRENVQDFEWDIAPVPGNLSQRTYGNQLVFAIPEAAANKDAAWELLRYLTTLEGASVFAEEGAFVPGLRAAADRITASADGTPAHLDLVLAAADNAVLPGRVVAAQQALQVYRPALDDVRNCQDTAPEVLDGMRSEIEEIIE